MAFDIKPNLDLDSLTYDFTTRVDRSQDGSNKWNAMYQLNPDVAPGIAPFSVADMEFVTAPAIVKSIQDWAANNVLGYTSPTDEYYDAVLGWQFRRHSWTPSLNWLVLSPGVVPALFNAVRAYTNIGDGVIIQPPVYHPFRASIESAGRKVVKNKLKIVDGRYEMDFEDLERRAADPANKLLILCSPHNPVGRVWTPQELRRVADICIEHDVFIVSDEIHNDLIMPGQKHTSFMKVLKPKEFGCCMVATAPSKTFNLAGLQCSNVFVYDRRMRELLVAEYEKNAFDNLTAFAYPSCIAAYEECEDWLDELIEVVWANFNMVKEFFETYWQQFKVIDMEGTYLAWVDLRECGKDHKEIMRVMRAHDLYFNDGSMFGKPGRGFIRWNLACPPSLIQESFDRLDAALKELVSED
jgi:cystathionine beta-lyase